MQQNCNAREREEREKKNEAEYMFSIQIGWFLMLKKTKNYFQLMRIKHWLKNIIIFIPAFYGGVILNFPVLYKTMIGFLIFSLCASAIYVINDFCDIEKDRSHPVKCKRPLASGAVSKTEGAVLLVICCITAILLNVWLCGISPGAFIPILYFGLNILYSTKLKNYPVTDIVILVSGFVLRMLYGSYITNIEISKWLYLTIMALSLFMAFGKRRNEKMNCGDNSRSVLSHYSYTYLNSSMYMYLAIFLVFYALWSTDTGTLPGMIYTTPLVIVMVMRYTYVLEKDEHGNPVDMIFGDKILIILCFIYALFVLLQIYFPEAFA